MDRPKVNYSNTERSLVDKTTRPSKIMQSLCDDATNVVIEEINSNVCDVIKAYAKTAVVGGDHTINELHLFDGKYLFAQVLVHETLTNVMVKFCDLEPTTQISLADNILAILK